MHCQDVRHYFLTTLICLALTSASAAPTSASTNNNGTSNWMHNYDIRFCNPVAKELLGVEIDKALTMARMTWQDATASDRGYAPFFKTRQYPVVSTLTKISEYEAFAERGRHITWICIRRDTKQLFPSIPADPWELCEATRGRNYIVFDSFILICPSFFTWPPEPPLPDPGICPEIVANTFASTGRIQSYRSDAIMRSLVMYRLPIGSPKPRPATLNDMVALDAYSSYLSVGNYAVYSISKCSEDNC